ncbi:hypothetical protein GCM10009744_36780 [Kribbella alba]|uniref:Uncharacterized protein n=1 Tax=Kribbella alba TaxID=190197 RepID=A0ABP4RAG5_9ACTN
MDHISAYREVCPFCGAAVISGITAKAVKRVIEPHESGGGAPGGVAGHSHDLVMGLVAERVAKTQGRITAERHCRSRGPLAMPVGAELPPSDRGGDRLCGVGRTTVEAGGMVAVGASPDRLAQSGRLTRSAR